MSPLVKPWAVLWLDWRFSETPLKVDDKFTVIVGVDDQKALCVIINSKVHEFIRANPDQYKCQVEITEKNHGRFLKTNSFAACHRTHKKSFVDLDGQVNGGVDRDRGFIHSSERPSILAAIESSIEIDDYQKEIIKKYLS